METKKLVEIVLKAQSGDSHAQQELYLDSSKSVYYLALKILRNKDDAEDMTQDVFVTVFEKLPELKQPAAYYKWLNQITANKCMSFLRKKRPLPIDEPDLLDALEMEDEGGETPETLYDDEETRRIIMEIIDALPDPQRVCVMYRYFNQLSIEEIAEITGANEHTVKSRLALARQKIRAAILNKEEKEGIRLHVLIPIMPVLMKSLEDFQMPEGVTAQIWERIAEGAGIAAGTAAAATEAAQAGTSGQVGPKLAEEAAKQGAKAKVIGGAVGAVAVAGLVAFLLWPKPEQPAPVTPPSTPAVTQPATPTPEPEPQVERTEIQDPAIEAAVRSVFNLGPDEAIETQQLDRIYSFSISPTHTPGQYVIWLMVDPGESGSATVDNVETLDLGDLILFRRLRSVSLESPPFIQDYSVLGDLDEAIFNSLDIIEDDNCTELPSLAHYYNMGKIRLVGLSNLTAFPQMGTKTTSAIEILDCTTMDLSVLGSMTKQTQLTIRNTPIADLSVIAQMESLMSLSLQNCDISDPTPLAALPNLGTLDLTGNPIVDTSLFDAFSDSVEIIY